MTGSLVKLSAAAIAAYDSAQAARYASTHETGNDERGAGETDTLDTSGENIPNYDNGTGSRVQCADGMYSLRRPVRCLLWTRGVG
jgi:hypothetical protein